MSKRAPPFLPTGAVRSPHPATVQRSVAPHPATVQRSVAPHPATIARRSAAPHPATVQRAQLPEGTTYQGNVTPDDRPPPTTRLTKEALKVRESEAPSDLSATAQDWHEALFAHGLVYGKTGELGTLVRTTLKAAALNGKYIYVLRRSGKLYVRWEPAGVQVRQDAFTHANFTGGKAVKAAGQIFVKQGQVIRIDNESGHYMPSGATVIHMLKKLNGAGVDLTKALLLFNQGSYRYDAYDASDYILGQKTKLPDVEWQSQEQKFADYMKGRDWNRRPVSYW